MSRARLGLWLGAAASLLSGLPAFSSRPARAAEDAPAATSETFAEGDPAGVAYLAKLNALVAAHAAELEKATRSAYEKNPCGRAELTMWLRVKPDGTITDVWSDPAPQLSAELVDAVVATFKTWKAPSTSRAKPVRLRVPLGTFPAAPLTDSLDCGAQVLDKGGHYDLTKLGPGVEHGTWWAVCRATVGTAGVVRSVKLHVKPTRPGFVSADKGKGKAKEPMGEVVVAGCDDPAFIFRGVHSTKEGPLTGAKVLAKTDAWDSTADVVLGDTSYHLRIEAKPVNGEGPPERPWSIVLEEGNATEEIDSGHTTLAPLLHVRWAGDLDGDGRPDFVLEDHSHGISLQLFVSGSAVGTQKVRRVAATSWGGS